MSGVDSMAVEAVIFDLGNVILPFDHHTVSQRLSALSPKCEGEIFRTLFRSQLGRDYDLGQVSSTEFFCQARSALHLDVGFGEFREIWCDIFSLNEGVARIIEALKGRASLFLLSNTNEMHFKHVRRHFEVVNLFDEALLSYQLGLQKPDPQIWQEAVRRAGVLPRQCAYVDDVEEYVEVARGLGLYAIHFRGVERLRRELEGLVPSLQ